MKRYKQTDQFLYEYQVQVPVYVYQQVLVLSKLKWHKENNDNKIIYNNKRNIHDDFMNSSSPPLYSNSSCHREQSSYSSPTNGSLGALLKEVTMTTTRNNNNSTMQNIYRQSNLPRKRLFAAKNYGGSMNNMNRKFKYVLIFFSIFVFGILFVTISFTLPSTEPSVSSVSSVSSSDWENTVSSQKQGLNIQEDSSQGIKDLHSTIKTFRNNNVPLVRDVKNKSSYNISKAHKGENGIDPNQHPFHRCDFRKYKPNRYYKVSSLSSGGEQNTNNHEMPKEPFLAQADYIRGKQPFVLNSNSKISSSSSNSSLMPNKLCLDTSEWEDVKPGYYPFSDGQNPSIVSLASNVYNLPKEEEGGGGYGYKDRIDENYIEPLANIYDEEHHDYKLQDLFLGLLLFGDSQCRWNLNESELEEMKFSPLMEPPCKRSMVIVLNEEMNIIDSTVLRLELDAKWGARKKLHVKKNDDGSYEKEIVELDDARLFFHKGQLHVLYRNGPYYGYDSEF
jgi:hypothetical protein